MKKALVFLLLLATAALRGGEVVFIPGWNTESSPVAPYVSALARIYPDDRITVLKWHSDIKLFRMAVDSADEFAPRVVEYIAAKSPEERSQLTLIGHSLGGRIAINAARLLAAKKLTVRQIVLLGSAVDCDVDLSPVAAAAEANCVNLFSPDDTLLKHIYPKIQYNAPLGFCGAETPPAARFVEYCIRHFGDGMSHIERAESALWIHSALSYLAELYKVNRGDYAPYHRRYDYSRAEKYLNDQRLLPALPPHWGLPLEGGIELYQMLRTALSRVVSVKYVPKIDKPVIRDSHAEWSLVSVNVTTAFGYEFKFHFIVDHYGRIRMGNLLERPPRKHFDEIKKRIVENLPPGESRL